MTAEADTVVWEGAEGLRPFLVPIADLEPFPGNPRVGDAKMVAGSLRRFGQLKPIVVDGARIIAGHHIVRGAVDELGWTHVAAMPNAFADEEEQRAFLLADNRASDLGTYDLELLTAQLRELADLEILDGTGYTNDDLDRYLADLVRSQNLDPPDLPDPPPAAPGSEPVDVVEVVLMFSKPQRDELEGWLKVVAQAEKTSGVSETVFAACRIASDALSA